MANDMLTRFTPTGLFTTGGPTRFSLFAPPESPVRCVLSRADTIGIAFGGDASGGKENDTEEYLFCAVPEGAKTPEFCKSFIGTAMIPRLVYVFTATPEEAEEPEAVDMAEAEEPSEAPPTD